MTNTAAATAARIAAQADDSQAIAEAYRHLARLIGTTPELARLHESEFYRANAQADEYESDADERRLRAVGLGYVPE